jgi:hypothetical protein
MRYASSMRRRVFCCAAALSSALSSTLAGAKDRDLSSTNMAGATILIIRHAEKPTTGSGLSPAGNKRAAVYAVYFNPFDADSNGSFVPDMLVASRGTTKSDRPELTLKPLSDAIGLSIDTHFANHDVKSLAETLRSTAHGKHILIAWHHGRIGRLIHALGGDPCEILPQCEWPGKIYDWVIELNFGKHGGLVHERRITENPFR